MKLRHRYLNSLLLFCLTFTLVPASAAAGIEDHLDHHFTVTPGGTLHVDAEWGAIHVSTGTEDAVEVRINRRFRSDDPQDVKNILENVEFNFSQSGNDVFVTVKSKGGDSFFSWLGLSHNRVRLSFEIKVPREFNLDMKTSGGSVSVSDLNGNVEARTSGGSLSFGHIKGELSGTTSGGSIHLDACKGNVSVRTSGGNIEIGGANGNVEARTSGGGISVDRAGGTVLARTSGGNIRVEEAYGDIDAGTSGGSVRVRLMEQPRGNCRLSTSGGSIMAAINPQLNLDIDAKSSGGRVDVAFPVTVQGTLSRTHLVGRLNDGGPKLTLRTSGGGIHLKKAQP